MGEGDCPSIPPRFSEGEYKGVLPPRQIVSAYPQLRPHPKSGNPGIVLVVKWCGGSASNSGDLMGWESHGLEDSPVDVARYRAVDDESRNLLVRAALGDEDRKGDVIDPSGWMVMFSRGLGGGDEMGVNGWVATAPWPPRCPHPSPLPPSGRGDGCCGRGRFGSGEGGGGCGARTAHRVDGAVGVSESGSTT